MRKFYWIWILIGLWFLGLVNCSKSNFESISRVGFFPVYQSKTTDLPDFAVTDYIARYCKENRSENILIVLPEWIANSIEIDSLQYLEYCLNHAKRIGLNRVYRLKVNSVSSNQFEMEVIHYEFSENVSDKKIFTGQLEPIANKISNTISSDSANKNNVVLNLLPNENLASVNLAIDAFFQGDFEKSSKQLRQILKYDPDNFYSQFWLAKSLLNQALIHQVENQSAKHLYFEIADLLQTLQLVDTVQTYLAHLKGKYYLQQGMWNQAELFLKKANKLDPKNPYILLDIARMHPSRYADMGFKNKEELLKTILRIYPGCEDAWIELGRFYFSKKQIQKAESVYYQWLQIHPGSMNAFLALGKLYLLSDNIPRLIETYEQILKLDPRSADAFYNLGIAYYRDEQFDTAQKFFSRAIELAEYPDAYFYLGAMAYHESNFVEAKKYFQKRIELRKSIEDEFADEAIRLIRKINATENRNETK